MRPKLEASLWIAGILVFTVVTSHWMRVWRGRSVPSFADYVDFAGIAFFMLFTTIVIGLWRSSPNGSNLVRNAIRRILMFLLRLTFFLIIPVAVLVPWLREWLFLGQRAMLYGGFALMATAGWVIARRLAAAKAQGG